MKYKLINQINPKYKPLEQVLVNRGIAYEDIPRYLNTSAADVNPPEALGEDLLAAAARTLILTVKNEEDCIVIVDCDCDGYTSSALLINYLYNLFPSWVLNHLTWIIHSEKQHGLEDCYKQILSENPSLVIIPDAGTNDTEECQGLRKEGINIIILDHHDKEVDNPYAIIINNQISDYPNKEFSGVGVTWQFCRYLDKILNTNYADNYIDLVALGLDADMMSLKSIETKHLILEGFKNVHNPFIYCIAEKNSFSLKGKITPIGAAFYIAPFVNAIVRSGTMEEKELVFNSMLSFKAFEEVLSTKRGHLLGEKEKLVDQAVRTTINVKARQTKIQNSMMDMLERKIEAENLLNHKVILFKMKQGEIDKNVAGLCANKIMAKYQRPVCILTKGNGSYAGSARGCDKVDIKDFKGICQETGVTEYTIGHPGAFGVCINEDNIETFLKETDKKLEKMPNEAIYYVDYIFRPDELDSNTILEIASMEDMWGKDIDESLIAIKGLKISSDMVTIYEKKSLAVKIQLLNGISILLFNASEEDCKVLQTNNTGYIEIDVIGTCHINEWMENVTAQIFIEEYQVVDSNKFFF